MSEDFERRFGGLRRLYGAAAAQRLFDAHVVVVGIGGVGSWAAEALARSGVARISLVDMDHVAESNINRQIHASDATLGQAKAEAMRERILTYHPSCTVGVVDAFVEPDNWISLLQSMGQAPDGVIDACDQVRAKTTMAVWAAETTTPLVTVGAAGGKRLAYAVEVADLGEVTHDPLLAQLRYRLRKHHSARRQGPMGWSCVFSREAMVQPDAMCPSGPADGSLNCHGYGSSVSVTATFGLCAAGVLMNGLTQEEWTMSTHPLKKAQKKAII